MFISGEIFTKQMQETFHCPNSVVQHKVEERIIRENRPATLIIYKVHSQEAKNVSFVNSESIFLTNV